MIVNVNLDLFDLSVLLLISVSSLLKSVQVLDLSCPLLCSARGLRLSVVIQ